jgi:hypothetical protein
MFGEGRKKGHCDRFSQHRLTPLSLDLHNAPYILAAAGFGRPA